MEDKDLNEVLWHDVLRCNSIVEEMKWMKKDIESLQNEYKTNKRYFCNGSKKPTINDVIKFVYEYAWASRDNFDIQYGTMKTIHKDIKEDGAED